MVLDVTYVTVIDAYCLRVWGVGCLWLHIYISLPHHRRQVPLQPFRYINALYSKSHLVVVWYLDKYVNWLLAHHVCQENLFTLQSRLNQTIRRRVGQDKYLNISKQTLFCEEWTKVEGYDKLFVHTHTMTIRLCCKSNGIQNNGPCCGHCVFVSDHGGHYTVPTVAVCLLHDLSDHSTSKSRSRIYCHTNA